MRIQEGGASDEEKQSMMRASGKFPAPTAWLVAAAIGLYLYYLLPATAVAFYELYHQTGIEPVYWAYSFFKIAGYYFGTWEYRLLSCVLVFSSILLLSWLWKMVKKS